MSYYSLFLSIALSFFNINRQTLHVSSREGWKHVMLFQAFSFTLKPWWGAGRGVSKQQLVTQLTSTQFCQWGRLCQRPRALSYIQHKAVHSASIISSLRLSSCHFHTQHPCGVNSKHTCAHLCSPGCAGLKVTCEMVDLLSCGSRKWQRCWPTISWSEVSYLKNALFRQCDAPTQAGSQHTDTLLSLIVTVSMLHAASL